VHKNNIFNTFFIISIILTLFIFFTEQINDIYGLHIYVPLPHPIGPINPPAHDFGKFVVYENSTIEPETELKGIVVGYVDGNILIVPDDNYRNLLTFGNIIYPEKGQLGYENHALWVHNYKKAKGIPISEEVHPPIILLETYGFCKDSECTTKYVDGLGDPNSPNLNHANGSRYKDKSIINSESPCYPIKLQIEREIADLRRGLENLDFTGSPGEKQITIIQIKEINKEIKQKQNEIKQCTETNPSHNGTEREIKPGDYIKIDGLYAIDSSHPIYYGKPNCQEKFEQRIWPTLRFPVEFSEFKEFDEALSQTIFFPFRPNIDPFSLIRLIDFGLVPLIGGFIPLSSVIDAFPWPILLCYNHAELHPYKPNSNRLIEPLKPGDINKESHIVVAPVPTQYVSMSNYLTRYSTSTYGDIDGPLGGRIVDFSTKKIVQSEFFMEAPPKPAICNSNPCILQFNEDIDNAKGPTSDPFKDGYINVKKEFTNNPDGVKVIVTVKGEDILNPTIYSASFSVWWEVDIIG
jgi:hypothetical protein